MRKHSGTRRAAKHGRGARRPIRAAAAVVAVVAVTVAVSGAMWVTHQAAWRTSPGTRNAQRAASSPQLARLPVAIRAAAGRAAIAVIDRTLSAALARQLRRHTGSLAVGVLDRSAGTLAFYHPGEQLVMASTVKVDILAALLLRGQRRSMLAGQGHSGNAVLAEQMMERSNSDAATRLWTAAGGAAGIRRANIALGLRHTEPAMFGAWGLTMSTVADQVRLLADLTGPAALTAASRSYEIGLMRRAGPGRRWGVAAVASPGTVPAARNGWLRFPQLWVVNSIGVIRYAGHLLCIAVLSGGQPSEAAGIRQVQAAALTAARLMTAAGRAWPDGRHRAVPGRAPRVTRAGPA